MRQDMLSHFAYCNTPCLGLFGMQKILSVYTKNTAIFSSVEQLSFQLSFSKTNTDSLTQISHKYLRL